MPLTYTLARRSTCQACAKDIEHAGRAIWQDRRGRVRCFMATDDAHKPGRQWFRAVHYVSADA